MLCFVLTTEYMHICMYVCMYFSCLIHALICIVTRIDRRVHVARPDMKGRKEIFKVGLAVLLRIYVHIVPTRTRCLCVCARMHVGTKRISTIFMHLIYECVDIIVYMYLCTHE